MCEMKELRLCDLHYCQDSIKCTFKDGRPLTELCQDFLTGKITLDTMPRMEVKWIHEKWMVMEGNRRLFVLKALHNHRMLPKDTVKVEVTTRYKEINAKGYGIRIRKDPSMEWNISNMIIEHKRRRDEEEKKAAEKEKQEQEKEQNKATETEKEETEKQAEEEEQRAQETVEEAEGEYGQPGNEGATQEPKSEGEDTEQKTTKNESDASPSSSTVRSDIAETHEEEGELCDK